MKVLHGTWIPSIESDFMQTGAFYLWVETPEDKKRRSSKNIHPGSLGKAELVTFLTKELGIAIALSALKSVFDPVAIISLEPGEATPIGKPGNSRRALPGGKIDRVYSRNETFDCSLIFKE